MGEWTYREWTYGVSVGQHASLQQMTRSGPSVDSDRHDCKLPPCSADVALSSPGFPGLGPFPTPGWP